VDTLLALDHLLGALERLAADLRGRLVQADGFFAHNKKAPPGAPGGALSRSRKLS
jgi:hypothetical protein